MGKYTYKIHPAIGVARVGPGSDAYDAPTTCGGVPTETDGSPVKNYRDQQGNIRPQSAVFQVYRYGPGCEEGEVVALGSGVGTATVKDIEWTAWLANKKAAWFRFEGPIGEEGGYARSHQLRNSYVFGRARQALILDPGPRTVSSGSLTAAFDLSKTRPDLRQGTGGGGGLTPFGVQNLGSVEMDQETGKLRVTGGDGYAGQVTDPLHTKVEVGSGAGDNDFANNTGWFDDISDGPVTARLVLSSGRKIEVDTPAWVLCGPPKFAPEIVNLITLRDTIYDLAVRTQDYEPDLFSDGKFNDGYKPSFRSEIQPILERPNLYRYVANLPQSATGPHANLVSTSDPQGVFSVIRPPDRPNQQKRPDGSTAMPYLAGDNPFYNYAGAHQETFLTLTQTQIFLLGQWAKGKFVKRAKPPEPPGRALDHGVLESCVGGPFVPGIEVTWVCRKNQIYSEPFRIKHKSNVKPGRLFHPEHDTAYTFEDLFGKGLEPGDLSAFMAQPWQSDYNLCSSQGDPGQSPGFNVHVDFTLWWWAAQRPDWVYRPGDPQPTTWIAANNPDDPTAIAFDSELTMVERWMNLGFIVRSGKEFPEFHLTEEVADPSSPTSSSSS